MAKENLWKKKVNLKNTKEAVEKYKRKYKKEGRRIEEEWKKMLGRFITKLLYR